MENEKIIIVIVLLSLFTAWFYLEQTNEKKSLSIIEDACKGENEFFVQGKGCVDLEKELETFRLTKVLPSIGGGGKIYEGIHPIDVNNSGNKIALNEDFNLMYLSV